ncbi:hypothetical protein [Evansella tamaricis]|uniref:Uncharacterized protein n=1 Tax=Evansella tamaricis TaxID=2069301 RepID=A0ABS6JKW5_9BACI|nr:hypothetical protein [Evansella tamaricis]MBU9713844.1 hypothetical protein [Evansella tamaricis]
MDAAYYYDLCCKHRGKVVRIYDRSGKEYIGKIANIDKTYVWLEPVHHPPSGFGYGYYGGWGYGWFPIALAAIGGFALGTAFFW